MRSGSYGKIFKIIKRETFVCHTRIIFIVDKWTSCFEISQYLSLKVHVFLLNPT